MADDSNRTAQEGAEEAQKGYRTLSCTSCGQQLEVPAELALEAVTCPACGQPIDPSATAPPATQTPAPDGSAAPTRVKTPSVLWRRFGAIGTDFVLATLLSMLGAFMLVDYPVSMTAVAYVLFGVLCLGTAMNTGATPGMRLVELRHSRSDTQKPLPTAVAAKLALVWVPLALSDIFFQEHLAISWQSPDASASQMDTPLMVCGAIMFFWYVLLFISTLSTKGKRSLADLVCGTGIDLSRPRFLSTSRRITSWSLGVFALALLIDANIRGYLYGAAELQAARAAAPVSADPVATYRPEAIHSAYQSHVMQVSTRWNRSMLLGLLSGQAVTSGSALLFVNDREYGLLVSNRHVVDVETGYLDGYECVVGNDLQTEPVRAEPVAFARNGIDLALLLIRLEDWEPGCVPIMTVAGLQVGEQAVALGNALGMGTSVTTGNISHLDETESLVFIRTSAPISPGNSGGPLILSRGGYVCGINTRTMPDRLAQNVNFAIPAEYIVYEELWDFWGGSARTRGLLAAARECLQ